MIKNGYSQNITVRYSEAEQNLAMKPYALLNFMQDLASENAENLGFGYSRMYPNGYAWFLLKYRMEFNEYPFGVKDFNLITEPRGCNKLFAYREFELKDGEKSLGRMFSQWSVVDIKTRSIVPVTDVVGENPYMVKYEKREDDLIFGKISQIESSDLEKEFEVRYNDLDINGHANNGNYIVWALEPLSFEFRNSHKIKTIDMIFKKEAKFGEKLISQVVFKSEFETIHNLINECGEILFQCCITFMLC